MSDDFSATSMPAPLRRGRRSTGNAPDVMSTIRAMASVLQERAGLAQAAGLTHGGSRDLYASLGYPRVIKISDYRARHKRGDIAKSIMEAYPRATWREGIELIEDEDPEIVTDFEQEFEYLDKRLGIWSMLKRVDILAGLGRYAALVIGATGKLEEELPRLKSQEDILYFGAYAEDEAAIDLLVNDTEDPRFGQPLFYKLKRSGGLERRVHWTRVIHVADGVLDESLYGTPRLEHVWNRLNDLDKILGGGSEAFWIRANPGTLLNVNPEVKVTPDEVNKLKEEAEDFIHGYRRTLALRGVEMSNLSSDVSNFGPQVASLLSIISGATGIPQRILLGSERGELSSTQDKENWNDRLSDRCHDFAEPLVRQLVDRLIEHGALPEPVEYNVRWPEVEELNEKEKAAVAVQLVGANDKAKGKLMTPAEVRDRVLGLPAMTDAQLQEIEDEKKANAALLPKMPGQPGAEDDQQDPPSQEPPVEPTEE